MTTIIKAISLVLIAYMLIGVFGLPFHIGKERGTYEASNYIWFLFPAIAVIVVCVYVFWVTP